MHDFLTGNCGDQNFHIIGTGSVWAPKGVIGDPIYKVREVYGHPRGIIGGPIGRGCVWALDNQRVNFS